MTPSSNSSRSRYSSCGATGRQSVRGDATFETFDRLPAQFCALVDRSMVFADREARQDRAERARPVGAALRNLDGGRDRFRQVGEHLRHLGAGLEAVLGRELAALGVGDHPSLGDRDQRVVRLVVLAGREIRLVGGDQRDALGVGHVEQHRLGEAFALDAVALQLDVEPVAEQRRQRVAARGRQRAVAGNDGSVQRPARPAGERNEAVGLALEPGELDMRRLVRRAFEKGAGVEPHQAAVAGLARGQQHDALARRCRGDATMARRCCPGRRNRPRARSR